MKRIIIKIIKDKDKGKDNDKGNIKLYYKIKIIYIK